VATPREWVRYALMEVTSVVEVKTLWFTKSRRAQNEDDYETWIEGGVMPTMNAFDNGDVRTTIIVFHPHYHDGARVQGDTMNTLTSRMGTGGNNVSMVATLMRMREGKKTFPFEGASNLRMPTGDTKIRKVKAALANVIFGIRPVVQVVPGPSGDANVARKIEKFLDHLIMDIMQIYPKALIAIDQTLEKGMSFLKPYWKNETTVRIERLKAEDFEINELLYITDPNVPKDEKLTSLADITEADMSEAVYSENEEGLEKALEEIMDGKTEVDVRLFDEICDYPDVCHVSSEYLYVPSNSPFNLQDCESVCHEFFLPKRKVLANKDKGWEVDKIKEFLDSSASVSNNSLNEKLTDQLKQQREGIERLNKTGDVRIQEFYCWYDLDEDGVPEKCIITIAADFRHNAVVLRIFRQEGISFGLIICFLIFTFFKLCCAFCFIFHAPRNNR